MIVEPTDEREGTAFSTCLHRIVPDRRRLTSSAWPHFVGQKPHLAMVLL